MTLLLSPCIGCSGDNVPNLEKDQETPDSSDICYDDYSKVSILDLHISETEISVIFRIPAICCHTVFVQWWHDGKVFDYWESSYQFLARGKTETVAMEQPFPKGKYELKILIGIVEKASYEFEVY